MASCSRCGRDDLPIRPWNRYIAVSHVSPTGQPCNEWGVTEVDFKRTTRTLDEEEMWDV